MLACILYSQDHSFFDFHALFISLQPLTGDKLLSSEFVDETVGMNIPKNFIPGIEKGFLEVCESGEEARVG